MHNVDMAVQAHSAPSALATSATPESAATEDVLGLPGVCELTCAGWSHRKWWAEPAGTLARQRASKRSRGNDTVEAETTACEPNPSRTPPARPTTAAPEGKGMLAPRGSEGGSPPTAEEAGGSEDTEIAAAGPAAIDKTLGLRDTELPAAPSPTPRADPTGGPLELSDCPACARLANCGEHAPVAGGPSSSLEARLAPPWKAKPKSESRRSSGKHPSRMRFKRAGGSLILDWMSGAANNAPDVA
jgi:hypothetical protein